MTQNNIIEQWTINLGLFEKLIYPCMILLSSHTGSNGDQMLAPKNASRHTVEHNRYRLTNCLFGECVRSQSLDRKTPDKYTLTFYRVSKGLQMRVNRRDARRRATVDRNEKISASQVVKGSV